MNKLYDIIKIMSTKMQNMQMLSEILKIQIKSVAVLLSGQQPTYNINVRKNKL